MIVTHSGSAPGGGTEITIMTPVLWGHQTHEMAEGASFDLLTIFVKDFEQHLSGLNLVNH